MRADLSPLVAMHHESLFLGWTARRPDASFAGTMVARAAQVVVFRPLPRCIVDLVDPSLVNLAWPGKNVAIDKASRC